MATNMTATEQKLALAVDVSFLLLTGMLILIMQAGFTALEVGGSRIKHTKSLLYKNFMDHSVGSLAWFGFGWGIFRGASDFAGGDGTSYLTHPVETYALLFNQFGFAATAATIVSGAVAGKCRLEPYVLMSFILTGFVYPVSAHWTWNPYGWLYKLGFLDFAGSCVVHVFGGSAAFAAAILCGPRVGIFVEGRRSWVEKHSTIGNENGSTAASTIITAANPNGVGDIAQPPSAPQSRQPSGRSSFIARKSFGARWLARLTPRLYQVRQIPGGHNPALMVVGGLLLYIAWFGFNCSQRSFTVDPYSSSISAVNTLIASGAGTTGMFLITKLLNYKFDMEFAVNSLLSSLVAITAGCGFLEPWAAVILGFISVPVYMASCFIILRVLGVDDTLRAISVHGTSGALGTVWLGLTHPTHGLFYGGGFHLLGVQVLGVLCVGALGFFSVLVIFAPFAYMKRLSYTPSEQLVGIDFVHFGGEFGKDIDLESQHGNNTTIFRRNSVGSAVSDDAPQYQDSTVRSGNSFLDEMRVIESSVRASTSEAELSLASHAVVRRIDDQNNTVRQSYQTADGRSALNDELKRVLHEDPRVRSRFRAFLEVTHASEGVEFWDAVAKFKSINKTKHLTKKMNEAKKIIKTFCMQDGERQVNLSSKNLKHIMSAMNEKTERLVENDLFDEALDELFKDLKLRFIDFVNNTPNYWVQ